MSVTYNGNTDYVRFVVPAAMDIDSFTVMIVTYPTTVQEAFGWRPNASSHFNCQIGDDANADEMEMFWTGSTNMYGVTNDANITANSWWFQAFVVDALTPKIYRGLLGGTITECGYATQTQGVSPTNYPSGTTAYICIRDNNDARRLAGHLHAFHYCSSALSLAELQQQANDIQPRSDSEILIFPGLHGASTVPDFSGKGISVTTANVTVGPGPPVMAPFARMIQVPHVAAAGPDPQSVAGNHGRFAGALTKKLMAKRTVSGVI